VRESHAQMVKRFESKFIAEPTSGCWLWEGTYFSAGYALISVKHKNRRASRVSWEIHRGLIPEGTCVLHKCDNRACVNPNHLFLGSVLDNHKDMDAKGRRKGNIKLSEEQVLAIKSNTRSISAIADEYGVTKSTVYKVKLRRRWAHL